jgi:hypothetical protein
VVFTSLENASLPLIYATDGRDPKLLIAALTSFIAAIIGVKSMLAPPPSILSAFGEFNGMIASGPASPTVALLISLNTIPPVANSSCFLG